MNAALAPINKLSVAGLDKASGESTSVDGSPWPVEIKDVNCCGVVAAVWDSLGLTELLDGSLPTDDQVSSALVGC
jgi:hypothetical protein